MSEQPKVIIRCLVYNHEPYLRDCLEGFVMQKTNFPFKAVVHDDCSTDGSAAIIREYAEKYPHIIEPIFETENQYSKRDDSLGRVMDAATLGRSPYIAYCEGDDYWTDPLKLQKQVDYMDAHPECSMTCTNAQILTPKGALEEAHLKRMNWPRPVQEGKLRLEDVIIKGGSYIFTCSIVCRESIIPELRKYAVKCDVGDFPLQIFSALKGDVFFFSDKMCIYRYCCPSSWSGNRTPETIMFSTIEDYCSLKVHPDVGQQANNVFFALIYIRKYRKKILAEVGHAIKYDYLKDYKRDKENIMFHIRRLMIYPYYPLKGIEKYVLPCWHPYVVLFKVMRFSFSIVKRLAYKR